MNQRNPSASKMSTAFTKVDVETLIVCGELCSGSINDVSDGVMEWWSGGVTFFVTSTLHHSNTFTTQLYHTHPFPNDHFPATLALRGCHGIDGNVTSDEQAEAVEFLVNPLHSEDNCQSLHESL